MDTKTIETLNRMCLNSFVDYLGIQFGEADESHITGSILITANHLQPAGYVHGGVYMALAETLAGAGSMLLVQPLGKLAFGTTINSQHVASLQEGKITGTAELIYESTFKHIWDIRITDSFGKLISMSRVTNSIK